MCYSGRRSAFVRFVESRGDLEYLIDPILASEPNGFMHPVAAGKCLVPKLRVSLVKASLASFRKSSFKFMHEYFNSLLLYQRYLEIDPHSA